MKIKKITTALLAILALSACGKKIKPETMEIMNGSGTESIGTMTVTRAKEAEVNDEFIKEWLEEVKDKGSNYDIIVYDESNTNNKGKGIYYNGGNSYLKNVDFELGTDLVFTLSGQDNAEEIKIK